ncbi:uncharacterized protein LOC131856645 [Cryptomeria japonica]|uniref:uncharacterized protein LOC131856645 n=1 Tax=Cryptomeria japonica TaxID=3369 RepID=UPI0027DA5136|nr:uncharacterized protein LOC131856645 [Cryptomeria japonica]
METHLQSPKSQNAVLESQNELFDFIRKTLAKEEKLLDPDLTQLIVAIDEFLLREKESTETKKEKFSENKHLRILDKCGNTIKLVGEKVSIFCEKNIKVGIEVLEGIGKCHRAAVGLVLVASVLEKMETKKRNKKECVMLLKSMNDLAKIVLELQPLPHETVKTQAKMKEAIHTIIHGAITCFTVLHKNGMTYKTLAVMHLNVVCGCISVFYNMENGSCEGCKQMHWEYMPWNDRVPVRISEPSMTFHGHINDRDLDQLFLLHNPQLKRVVKDFIGEEILSPQAKRILFPYQLLRFSVQHSGPLAIDPFA